MTPRFRKLQPNDSLYIAKIVRLLRSSYNPKVSKYFIYQSSAYPNFFESLISTDFDSIFIAEDSTAGSLIGFVQFKHEESVLFLKNIVVEDAYRGTGIGSTLLLEAINSLKNDNKELHTFALDVFEHNSNVYQWYLRSGRGVTSTKFWYDAFPAYRNTYGQTGISGNKSVTVNEDKLGFKQIFVSHDRVGTLIDESTLMLATFSAETMKHLSDFFGNSIERICYISGKEVELPIIDISHRLEISLDDFLSNLSRNYN